MISSRALFLVIAVLAFAFGVTSAVVPVLVLEMPPPRFSVETFCFDTDAIRTVYGCMPLTPVETSYDGLFSDMSVVRALYRAVLDREPGITPWGTEEIWIHTNGLRSGESLERVVRHFLESEEYRQLRKVGRYEAKVRQRDTF
jgi:hypothetical protein